MLDLGWSELLVIGVVALIVVGPKDLPVMFRTLGKFTARLRGMARDFTRAMEEAADEAGVKDVAKDIRSMSNPKSAGLDAFRKATSMDDLDFDPFADDDEKPAKPAAKKGPETQKMTEERAEAARKIQESAAARATARLEAEAAARAEAASAAAADSPDAPAPSKSDKA